MLRFCLGLLLLTVAPVAQAAERQLVDEVVAVVEAQSITYTELEAETRIRLAVDKGPAMAMIRLDRPLLAASLRRLVEERVVLAEVERLRLFDLDNTERALLLARLRQSWSSNQGWEDFLRKLEMTEEEVGAVLARTVRVVRYLENRLKLISQLRDSELEDAIRKAGDTAPRTSAQREVMRARLAQEKYERLLGELLAELRKRANVRILDPLDGSGPEASTRAVP